MTYKIFFFDSLGRGLGDALINSLDNTPCDEEVERVAFYNNIGEYSTWDYELVGEDKLELV